MLSCLIFQTVHNIRISKIKLETEKDDGGAMNFDGAKLAGECMKGLVKNIPPSFCWKKGGDAGVIPTLCPNGYFRSLALCYEYCKPGYRHVLGVCYEDCPHGFADMGLFCFRWFEFRGKGIYAPRSLTNFSHEVPCYPGMFRIGALCYRNCENINMENCGIGACVADQAACASTIVNMVVSVLQSIADIVTLVVTFGASSSTTVQKQQLVNGVKKIGQQGLRASVKGALKSLKGRFQKDIIKKSLKEVRDFVKDSALGTLKSNFVSSFCSAVYETAINKANPEKTFNLDTVVDTLDVLNIKGMISGCSNTSDGGLDCAKNVLTSLSTFDPTGLLGVTTAFMHPECDVPTQKPTIEEIPEDNSGLEILTLGECDKRCEDAINNCINAPVNKGYEKQCRSFLPVCKIRCNVEVCMESCRLKEQYCLQETLFDKNFCADQRKLCQEMNCDGMSKCGENCEFEVNNCATQNPTFRDSCHWEFKPKCFVGCNKNNQIKTDDQIFYQHFQNCVNWVQECKNAPVNRGVEHLCNNIYPKCNASTTINVCRESCQKQEEICLSTPSSDKRYCSNMKSTCFEKYCDKFSTCISNCDQENRKNNPDNPEADTPSKYKCYEVCNIKKP